MVSLPSWLKPADPAQYQAEGMRIADSRDARAQEAAERGAAGERAQQELMFRQQQLEAQATQAAQKYAAQRQYQDAIAGGADPVQAILKFGPAMGQGAGVGAALHAQQLRQPKPQMAAPTIQMQQGPDGTQIPILVHGGRASVIPRSAYAPKPQTEPEQWQEVSRKINGRDVPGQQSSKTGKFQAYPASDQAGAISPQTRAQLSQANRKKAELAKVLGDESQMLQLAKKRAGGKSPTHADLEAVEADLQKQHDALDDQIEKLTGGGDAKEDKSPHPDGTVLKNKKDGKTYVVKDGVPVPQEEQ